MEITTPTITRSASTELAKAEEEDKHTLEIPLLPGSIPHPQRGRSASLAAPQADLIRSTFPNGGFLSSRSNDSGRAGGTQKRPIGATRLKLQKPKSNVRPSSATSRTSERAARIDRLMVSTTAVNPRSRSNKDVIQRSHTGSKGIGDTGNSSIGVENSNSEVTHTAQNSINAPHSPTGSRSSVDDSVHSASTRGTYLSAATRDTLTVPYVPYSGAGRTSSDITLGGSKDGSQRSVLNRGESQLLMYTKKEGRRDSLSGRTPQLAHHKSPMVAKRKPTRRASDGVQPVPMSPLVPTGHESSFDATKIKETQKIVADMVAKNMARNHHDSNPIEHLYTRNRYKSREDLPPGSVDASPTLGRHVKPRHKYSVKTAADTPKEDKFAHVFNRIQDGTVKVRRSFLVHRAWHGILAVSTTANGIHLLYLGYILVLVQMLALALASHTVHSSPDIAKAAMLVLFIPVTVVEMEMAVKIAGYSLCGLYMILTLCFLLLGLEFYRGKAVPSNFTYRPFVILSRLLALCAHVPLSCLLVLVFSPVSSADTWFQVLFPFIAIIHIGNTCGITLATLPNKQSLPDSGSLDILQPHLAVALVSSTLMSIATMGQAMGYDPLPWALALIPFHVGLVVLVWAMRGVCAFYTELLVGLVVAVSFGTAVARIFVEDNPLVALLILAATLLTLMLLWLRQPAFFQGANEAIRRFTRNLTMLHTTEHVSKYHLNEVVMQQRQPQHIIRLARYTSAFSGDEDMAYNILYRLKIMQLPGPHIPEVSCMLDAKMRSSSFQEELHAHFETKLLQLPEGHVMCVIQEPDLPLEFMQDAMFTWRCSVRERGFRLGWMTVQPHWRSPPEGGFVIRRILASLFGADAEVILKTNPRLMHSYIDRWLATNAASPLRSSIVSVLKSLMANERQAWSTFAQGELVRVYAAAICEVLTCMCVEPYSLMRNNKGAAKKTHSIQRYMKQAGDHLVLGSSTVIFVENFHYADDLSRQVLRELSAVAVNLPVFFVFHSSESYAFEEPVQVRRKMVFPRDLAHMESRKVTSVMQVPRVPTMAMQLQVFGFSDAPTALHHCTQCTTSKRLFHHGLMIHTDRDECVSSLVQEIEYHLGPENIAYEVLRLACIVGRSGPLSVLRRVCNEYLFSTIHDNFEEESMAFEQNFRCLTKFLFLKGAGKRLPFPSKLDSLQYSMDGMPVDYVFEHLVIQSALYESVPNAEVLLVHDVVADAYESVQKQFPSISFLPEIVHHLEQAGDEGDPALSLHTRLHAAQVMDKAGLSVDALIVLKAQQRVYNRFPAYLADVENSEEWGSRQLLYTKLTMLLGDEEDSVLLNASSVNTKYMSNVDVAEWMMIRAEISLRRGQFPEARAHADRSLEYVKTLPQRYKYIASRAYRLIGLAVLEEEREKKPESLMSSVAAQHLSKALRLAQTSGFSQATMSVEAEACTELAMLYTAKEAHAEGQARMEQGKTLFQRAITLYRYLSAVGDFVSVSLLYIDRCLLRGNEFAEARRELLSLSSQIDWRGHTEAKADLLHQGATVSLALCDVETFSLFTTNLLTLVPTMPFIEGDICLLEALIELCLYLKKDPRGDNIQQRIMDWTESKEVDEALVKKTLSACPDARSQLNSAFLVTSAENGDTGGILETAEELYMLLHEVFEAYPPSAAFRAGTPSTSQQEDQYHTYLCLYLLQGMRGSDGSWRFLTKLSSGDEPEATTAQQTKAWGEVQEFSRYTPSPLLKSDPAKKDGRTDGMDSDDTISDDMHELDMLGMNSVMTTGGLLPRVVEEDEEEMDSEEEDAAGDSKGSKSSKASKASRASKASKAAKSSKTAKPAEDGTKIEDA